MRVLTFNLFSHHRRWAERREVIRSGINALAPDVVTLQEVVLGADYDQAKEVLGPDYHVFHQGGRSPDGVGAAIASRWPFTVLLEQDLHEPGGDSTGWIGSLAVAEIEVPMPVGPVLLAHHKPTWQLTMEHVRERQAVGSARAIEELLEGSDRHVILAGDFDAAPDTASLRFWTGKQSLDGLCVRYQDAWTAIHQDEPGYTFTPRNGFRSASWNPRPPERIDYVLVRCGAIGSSLDVTASQIAFDQSVDGVWASDHFAVVADLVPGPVTSDPT